MPDTVTAGDNQGVRTKTFGRVCHDESADLMKAVPYARTGPRRLSTREKTACSSLCKTSEQPPKPFSARTLVEY